MPATDVGLSSFPEGVAISYERSGHTQLYHDCPVKRPAFPIVRKESPASERCASPPPAAPCLPPLATERPPCQGVWAAATIELLGMRSLECSGLLMHANHLGHGVPA